MVGHQLADDADATPVRLLDEGIGVPQRSEQWIDIRVVGDVVAVIAHWRWVERKQPYRVDAEVLQVWELFDETAKVAPAVRIAVIESADWNLAHKRVLAPPAPVLQPPPLDI